VGITYLAGPINGCTDNEAINWREVAKARLGDRYCLDPMRRDYRGREDECVDEIVAGDLADIAASDVMLANCWQVSWGTAMEIFYASSVLDMLVYAVLPPDARVSPWLRHYAHVISRDLNEAIDCIHSDEQEA
jgi:hypothetical protein